MFRYLILSIFALFAALAVVGVERSTVTTPTNRVTLIQNISQVDDPPRIAVVLQATPVLEQPASEARKIGQWPRGEAVTVVRISSGGWTQARSADGELGFIPTYALRHASR